MKNLELISTLLAQLKSSELTLTERAKVENLFIALVLESEDSLVM